MATVIRSFRKKTSSLGPDAGAYLPSQEEIAEKTAEIREARIKRKLAGERVFERKAIKKADMTKDDICNVEPISIDELFDSLKMSEVEEINNRWATTEEGQL